MPPRTITGIRSARIECLNECQTRFQENFSAVTGQLYFFACTKAMIAIAMISSAPTRKPEEKRLATFTWVMVQ